jgi:hypothetical protein
MPVFVLGAGASPACQYPSEPSTSSMSMPPSKPGFRETDLGRIGLLWLNGVSGFGHASGRLRADCAPRRWARRPRFAESRPLVKRSPPGTKEGSPAVVGIHFHIGEKKIPGSVVEPTADGRSPVRTLSGESPRSEVRSPRSKVGDRRTRLSETLDFGPGTLD